MSREGKLAGKVAIVTGSASGIGKAMVEAFVEEEAKVIVADYNIEGAEAVAEALNEQVAGVAYAFQVDVSKQDQCDAMVDFCLEKFGQVDILVNNAGIMDGFEPVGRTKTDRFHQIQAVNVDSVFFTMHKLCPIFEKQGHGSIVNIASAGGLGGGRAGAAYSASKHAVIGLTKNTAVHYANKGIRCNALCPGGVETNIGHSMGHVDEEGMVVVMDGALSIRQGQADEIAKAAVFLASDDASYVNGAILAIDGGLTAV